MVKRSLVLATLMLCAATAVAPAAPGDPDRSFGTNGTLLLDLGGAEGADALLPLPGGAFVVAGYGDGTSISARFTGGGDRDTSFGDGGVVVTPRPGVSGAGVGPVPSFRQGDGRLISAGAAAIGSGTREDPFTSGTRLAVYRVTADGRPDPSFGSGGTAALPGDANRASRAVLALPQAGGRILAVGTSAISGRADTSELLFARFNPDGSPDASFGDGGSRTAPAAGLGGARIDVAALEGGGFAVAYCDPRAGGARPRVMRFAAGGELDTAFGGGDGVAEVTRFGCGFGEAHVAVQSDAKLVVGAGTTDVARFAIDGAPDPTFGAGGEVVTPGGDAVAGVVVQPDGRIVMASGDFGVIRFTSDGSIDPVFATQALGSGKRGGGQAEDVALGSAGTILVAGLSTPPATDIKVMRFQGGGGSALVTPLPRRQSLSRVLARGLDVTATCPTACVVSSELRMDARIARRIGAVAAARTVRVGGGRKRLRRAGATTVRTRFTGAARRALRRQRRARVTLVTTLRPRTGRVTIRRQVLTLRR